VLWAGVGPGVLPGLLPGGSPTRPPDPPCTSQCNGLSTRLARCSAGGSDCRSGCPWGRDLVATVGVSNQSDAGCDPFNLVRRATPLLTSGSGVRISLPLASLEQLAAEMTPGQRQTRRLGSWRSCSGERKCRTACRSARTGSRPTCGAWGSMSRPSRWPG
jgi:hypothetical protein